MARNLTLLIGFLCWALSLNAQQLPFPLDIPLPGVTRYNPAIPTPEAIIGHRIGTRHTEPYQIVTYFQAVAQQSPRVHLESHGATYENRPLIHAFISSPENLARLEEIRQQNLKLSENPTAVSDDELKQMPVVVYMGYSIHGNEASGSEAALLTLYHLAAGEGPAIDSILQNVVLILDPSFNPDGRARFTTYVNQNRGKIPVADPQDREHNEPWPGGRTNHYWFDLNRDWLPVQHPESNGRIKLFHHWRPQLLTDHHEMGSEATYFFQPGVPSRNNPNTPTDTYRLTTELAQYHARFLDRIGSLYFTKETFDDFYYGKGSTYPDINGAVGILFEQASSRALMRETSDGILTYAFTIRNQFITSLSTLTGAAEMREKFLRHQRMFYQTVPNFVRQQPVKAYLIDKATYPVRAVRLAQLLQKHRIRIHALNQPVRINNQTITPENAWIIPLDQPQARLIKAIMERVTSFKDSLFYDVSTWTLPLAFGVQDVALRRVPREAIGPAIEDFSLPEGKVHGEKSAFAYLMPWGTYYAPAALYAIQKLGLHPRLAIKPFSITIQGKPHTFDRGTIIIPVAQRDTSFSLTPEAIHAHLTRIAKRFHVNIYGVSTGLVAQGPDLGSRSIPVLPQPRIALLTGNGISAYQAGEVWHLLNERMHIPVSLLDAHRIPFADLSRYNTIILAGPLRHPESEAIANCLKQWISEGGTFVATQAGAQWAIEHQLITGELRTPPEDYPEIPYIDIPAYQGARRIGGAIFQIELDTTHPLAFGARKQMPVFRNTTLFYEPVQKPGVTVAKYTQNPLLSGYIHPEMLELLRNSAAILADRSGKGHIVLLVDNPNFRAFWYGTNGLFMNALFFGHVF